MPFPHTYRILPILAFSLNAALALTAPANAEGFAGPYLAARQADIAGDYSANVEYGIRALARDPDNMDLMEGLIVAEIGLGEFGEAVPVARRLQGLSHDNQIAGLVLLADAIRAENWAKVLAALDDGTTIGGLLDLVIRGWAQVGSGKVTQGLKTFASLEDEQDPGRFSLYHSGLAMALAGDFEGAVKVFSGEAGGALQLDRQGLIAYAQILSQLERNQAAVELLDKAFPGGGDGEIALLRRELAAGKPIAFSAIASPRDGLADVFFSVAQSLARDLEPKIVLLYSRTADFLKPELYEATLLSATLLEMLERFELAVPAYAKVPESHRLYLTASLSRAEALRRWGDSGQAIAVLEALAKSHPDAPKVHKTLGDTLRFLGRCDEATNAYDKAVQSYETPAREQWGLIFARGICHEQLDNWPEAEADFRLALELNPEQPSVLNYLGYSFVEQKQNLDEALDMIERAVAARPADGFITDSLGWVYYRLGRYGEAVVQMERAVELVPVDPIINDHLGDVYWAVGRRLEAEFQWHRALSFISDDTDPDEIDPDRIRRKLEVGLDVVLEEEGADPLIRSDEDG